MLTQRRSLEAFIEAGDLELRDDLASRAGGFSGLPLSDAERALLVQLDVELDELSPSPAPLSAEVQEILREVREGAFDQVLG